MEFNFDLQLFGGGGGGSTSSASSIKTSAPGSTQAATIDNATAGARQNLRDKLSKAYNRNATNVTANNAQLGGSGDIAGQVKKALLGE